MIVITAILCLCASIIFLSIETEGPILTVLFLILGIILVYFAVKDYNYIPTKVSYENMYQSFTLKDTDYIITNDERLINLNRLFGKDIPDKSTIIESTYVIKDGILSNNITKKYKVK